MEVLFFLRKLEHGYRKRKDPSSPAELFFQRNIATAEQEPAEQVTHP